MLSMTLKKIVFQLPFSFAVWASACRAWLKSQWVTLFERWGFVTRQRWKQSLRENAELIRQRYKLQWDYQAHQEDFRELACEYTDLESKYAELEKQHKALQVAVRSKADLEQSWQQLQQTWLDYHITRLEKSSYAGCGLYYERYAERFTAKVDNFLATDAIGLSAEAIQSVKSHADYYGDDNTRSAMVAESDELHAIRENDEVPWGVF